MRSLETHPVGHARRREALCAVLEVDGEDEAWPELPPPRFRCSGIRRRNWAAAVSRAGLAGLGGAVFPTGIKLAAAWRRPIHSVVVNGVECEPYISCDDVLMRASPREVLAGALALMELAGAGRGFMVIEKDKPEALQALQRELQVLGAGERLTLVTVPAIYPAGGERQLIQQLTGHEVPSLAYPTDIGYLCQNVGTAVALYRFLQSGHPLTSRITTITGGGIVRPRNLEVRLGTRIADLIAACGGYEAPVARLIMGRQHDGHRARQRLGPCHARHQLYRRGHRTGIGPRRRCAAVYRLRRLRNRLSRRPDAAGTVPRGQERAVRRGRGARPLRLHRMRMLRRGLSEPHPAHRKLRGGKRRFVQTMDHEARVRWFDAREQLRRRRVQHWEAEHGPGTEKEASPARRAEAVAEVVAQ